MEQLQYVENYKDDPVLRQSLSLLAAGTFGLGFEDWYQAGYWDGCYVPHSFAVDGRIVANVSTSRLRLLHRGGPLWAVQLGTVMTAPDWRGRGLSRRLLEQVLEDNRGRCDLLYLFANESVLNFYPRFGFVPAQEWEWVIPANQTFGSVYPVRPLDVSLERDRSILSRLIAAHQPVSPILSVEGNQSLCWFYLGFQCPELAYYIEGIDAVVVMEWEGDTLFLLDILCEHSLSLPAVIASVKGGCKKICLGFLPGPEGKELGGSLRLHDDHLFVYPGKFTQTDILFPFLSRA